MRAALLSFTPILLPAPSASYLPLRAFVAAFFLPPERFLAALRLPFLRSLAGRTLRALGRSLLLGRLFLGSFFFFAGAFSWPGSCLLRGSSLLRRSASSAPRLGRRGRRCGWCSRCRSSCSLRQAAPASDRPPAYAPRTCAPYGSTNCAIQSPPGTSIGPLTSVPRARLGFLDGVVHVLDADVAEPAGTAGHRGRLVEHAAALYAVAAEEHVLAHLGAHVVLGHLLPTEHCRVEVDRGAPVAGRELVPGELTALRRRLFAGVCRSSDRRRSPRPADPSAPRTCRRRSGSR